MTEEDKKQLLYKLIDEILSEPDTEEDIEKLLDE